MTTFRKLPVEIEAFRLGDEWPEWWADAVSANKVITNNNDGSWRSGPDNALIQTLEGTMSASFGDWIIRGVKGEIYPCKPDIFAATYEPVTLPPSTEGAEIVRKLSQMSRVRGMWTDADREYAARAATHITIQEAELTRLRQRVAELEGDHENEEAK